MRRTTDRRGSCPVQQAGRDSDVPATDSNEREGLRHHPSSALPIHLVEGRPAVDTIARRRVEGTDSWLVLAAEELVWPVPVTGRRLAIIL